MKISVELSHECPLDEVVAHGKAADDLGFQRIWVPDTLVSPWDAWIAASLIAQTTQRVGIGLGVTNPFTRHPVVMAQMAATLQRVSSQRLCLSLGKGIGRFLEKIGIHPEPTAEKECVEILRDLLSGNKTDYNGQAFRLNGVRLRTLPPENPVLIYRAATSPEGWMAVLEAADGVVTFWGPGAAENRNRAMARRHLPTAAMIPFTLTRKAFFGQAIHTEEDLKKDLEAMEAAGFDEAIIAYRDRTDLEAAAALIRG